MGQARSTLVVLPAAAWGKMATLLIDTEGEHWKADSLSYTVVTGWEMKKQLPAARAALWEHLIAQAFGLSLNDQMKASKTRALPWSRRTQEALLPFGEHSTTELGLPSLPLWEEPLPGVLQEAHCYCYCYQGLLCSSWSQPPSVRAHVC